MPFQWNYGTKRKRDTLTGGVKKRRSKHDRSPLSNKINNLDTHAKAPTSRSKAYEKAKIRT